MKAKFLISASALSAVLLAMSSCSSENSMVQEPDVEPGTLTFNLKTPGGDDLLFTRAAIHDEAEWKINTLSIYEYEVSGSGTSATETLTRVLTYPSSSGNAVSLTSQSNNSYGFTILIPQDYGTRKFTYKFVANTPHTAPAVGSAFSTGLKTLPLPEATQSGDGSVTDWYSADRLAQDGVGIAMTGVATQAGSEQITPRNVTSCDVKLTRAVARVDIRFQTPNLKITNVELKKAPKNGSIFLPATLPTPAAADQMTCRLNANVTLPTKYIREMTDGTTTVELKKAFYLYERANTAADYAYVHIDYAVADDTKPTNQIYTGSLDVPFRQTSSGSAWVNTQRNHLYTIVLGNGNKPVAGDLQAKLIVDDWNLIDINQPLTD